MKKIILCLALAASVWAGQFEGKYSTKKGDIKISDSTEAVSFLILTAGGSSISAACDLSGIAALQTKTAALFQTNSDMGGCSVMLDFSQTGIVAVKSRGCQMFCTDRSSFDGEYKITR